MRLAVHTVLCCCVFTTMLPLVKGATGEINTSMRKRFRVWLQNRVKNSSLATPAERHADLHVGSRQDGNVKTVYPPSSFGLKIRARRAASSKSSSCVLITCAYHDLLHRLYQINNWQKEATAPEKKMSPTGYGRRRRSLQGVTQVASQAEGERWNTEAGQQLCRHKSICTVA
ncbi:pro-adrenomedullin-like [Brachionichthys hirsutus]|uniref:pro-adrenomedullin-like n=1 Tax=Brachionichthys hirsutus TaxID=412623 RepID=UPI0036043F4B